MKEGTINIYSENDFELSEKKALKEWLRRVAVSEGKTIGEINYIFCDDAYLHTINLKFLNHDTYTDIISFDNCVGSLLNGDIFISTERVLDNAHSFKVSFDEELKRVMVHGILHFCGFADKSESESIKMRQKEDEKIAMFHVEH